MISLPDGRLSPVFFIPEPESQLKISIGPDQKSRTIQAGTHHECLEQ